jgi:hypothetical protein
MREIPNKPVGKGGNSPHPVRVQKKKRAGDRSQRGAQGGGENFGRRIERRFLIIGITRGRL